MKRSAATLIAAEMHAFTAEQLADEAWLSWVRMAVAGGVRCDVLPESLRALPRLIEVAPNVTVARFDHD